MKDLHMGNSEFSILAGDGTFHSEDILSHLMDLGVPVHHDPVHGIAANPGNREWRQSPLSFFVFCRNPVHRVLVNSDPPISQYLGLPGTIQNCITSIPGN